MISLSRPPRLVPPTTRVKTSYLVGEQADCVARGTPTEWLAEASLDFAAFVEARRGVLVTWDVPTSIFWYVSGPYYLGALALRHELTDGLADKGGNIGYHVVAPWRRQGHATRMLAHGLDKARGVGLERVLLTTGQDNLASQKVILANGGRRDEPRDDEERFWIDL